jgi:hypothetical protein
MHELRQCNCLISTPTGAKNERKRRGSLVGLGSLSRTLDVIITAPVLKRCSI